MAKAPSAWRQPAAVIGALTIALGGCGSTTRLLHSTAQRPAPIASPGVPAGVVSVIRGWSDALRSGDVTAASRYFGIPSIFATGSGPPLALRTLTQVEVANAGLPCGAELISVRRQGRYVGALFRLTNRPGPGGEHGCGTGAGLTARTDFLVRHGRIVQWVRAPDEPGDNGSPPTSPAPSSPGGTAGPTI